MSTKNTRFLPKRTAVPGRIPTGTTGEESSFIKQGELAVNTVDKKIFSFDGLNIFEFGANSYLNLSGGTIDGNFTASGNTSLQTVSATTIIFGSTNLYNIFQQLKITGTTLTTNATVTTAATVSNLSTGMTQIIFYVTANGSTGASFGSWRRTVNVLYTGSTIAFPLINYDMDYQQGALNPNSVMFVGVVPNVYLTVSGTASNNITWKTSYEIIL